MAIIKYYHPPLGIAYKIFAFFFLISLFSFCYFKIIFVIVLVFLGVIAGGKGVMVFDMSSFFFFVIELTGQLKRMNTFAVTLVAISSFFDSKYQLPPNYFEFSFEGNILLAPGALQSILICYRKRQLKHFYFYLTVLFQLQ